MPDYARIYRQQEYTTPGAAETVALFAAALRQAVADPASATVIEVPSGKGEAACTLAAELGCRVIAVELYPSFLMDAARKAEERGLQDRVGTVCGDGKRLPLVDGIGDGALSIGAPSIVGLHECLGELARVVGAGAPVVVSDVVWRSRPREALGAEWGEWADASMVITQAEYEAALAAAGLGVEQVVLHPMSAWDEYQAPLARVAAEARRAGDESFAAEVEAMNAVERRGAGELFDYTSFVCRRVTA